MEYNSSSKLKAYIKYEYGFPFLDLSRKGLSQVPDAVTELTEVEVLKLNNNNLTELPTSINRLKNLVRLHLYSNRLTELPAEIGDLKKLNALYVSSNQLVSLPTSIQTLNQLEVLELDGNKITELPSQIGDLKKLKKLYVYSNQLVGLPTSIQKLNQLQDLNLSNNTLTELPAVIGDLKQLRSLSVKNNQLVSLPTSIQKLNKLEGLKLCRNKLTELPSEIGDLKELRRLDVSYNQLVSLPTSIQKLSQLDELHVNNNKLTELPSEIGDLKQLTILDVSGNPLPSDAIHVLEMKIKGMTSRFMKGVEKTQEDAIPQNDYKNDAAEGSRTDPASTPPEVNLSLLKTEDLPETGVPWDDGPLPTDILLLTVEDCEFLGCLSYLNSGFCRSYCKQLGYVYFGELGRGEMKVKISVMKCYKGSITAGGSAVSVSAAVRVLRPKAVFLVGICHSLKSSEVKLGDVAISEMLITCVPCSDEVGDKVPLKSVLLKLIPNAGDGWKAPLKDPKALKVKIHRGDFLSVPGLIDNNECHETLIKRFPQAIAMELEGQGLYVAAHALDVPWIIIKGISDYADCRKSGTDRWRSFATSMAASLTAHILSDPVVFQDWAHYNETD